MDQLTREVVNEIQHAYNFYHVHIYLFNESRQDLVMAGGTGEAGQVMLARRHHIPVGRGLVGRAATTNKAVLVGNTSQDPGWLPNPLLPETKSELAVPISSGERVLGVLDVQQNVEDGLTEADVDLIQLTANQVAIALQNAMTYSQTQQKAEHEALVASVGQKIQQAATIDEVLQVAVRELGQALGAQYSSVELRPQTMSTDEITGSREG
jgi:GAF domain-containing protein